MRDQSSMRIFESDTRGVSEAIAQAVIFMIVIASASGVALAGQDLIDNAQDEASFEQSVIGFESFDDTAQSFTTNADEDILYTAKRQATLYSRNADLEQVSQETEIVINDTDSNTDYLMSSQPFRVVHNQYTLTYDSGLIQSERVGTTNVLRTPADQHPATSRTLHLRTIRTNSTAQFHGGSRQLVLLSEDERSTVFEVSAGDEIQITTNENHETMWETYIENREYITDLSIDNESPGEVTITAGFDESVSVYHQQLHVEPRDRFRDS